MNKIIVTTGYMGSGSSAMTDLISEINGFTAPNNSFEYVFMHCPNGVFDLEEKLTSLNNANRSDEAIRAFLGTMRMLYEISEDDYWIAGYKKNISEDFMNFVEEFMLDLGVTDVKGTWYDQQKPCFSYKCKILLWKIRRKLKFQDNPIPSNFKEMKLAFPTKAEFYNSAKKFLYKIYQSLGFSSNNLIMDQLVLPHNLFRANNYFDTDITCFFVVDRDPRDIFILNKYYWNSNPVPYPIDVHEFCKMYRKIREAETEVSASNILRFHFEDLIYNYDETLKQIYSYLGVNSQKHSRKGELFNPGISINNTQVFKRKAKFKDESDYIAQCLPEYLYEFPYEKKGDGKVF